MRFVISAVVLAATAAAAPQVFPSVGAMPLDQAHTMCGNQLELNCCNQAPSQVGAQQQRPDMSSNPGLLGGLLSTILGNGDGMGLFGQCSPLSVSGIPGGGDILNSHCRTRVACCERTNTLSTGGLVNIALPCIALGSIVG